MPAALEEPGLICTEHERVERWAEGIAMHDPHITVTQAAEWAMYSGEVEFGTVHVTAEEGKEE